MSQEMVRTHPMCLTKCRLNWRFQFSPCQFSFKSKANLLGLLQRINSLNSERWGEVLVMERVISGQFNWMQHPQSLNPRVRRGFVTHSSSSLLCYSALVHVFFSLTKHNSNPMMAEAVRGFLLSWQTTLCKFISALLKFIFFDCWYWVSLTLHTRVYYSVRVHWKCKISSCDNL